MFTQVEGSVSFPRLEEEIIRLWRRRKIYEKSLAARRDAPAFVFYEGPPTANGLPHPGHCLTRAIKDLFPRYRTMRGYCCQRKAGWDTHGLPVEVEVCKELGIHSKEEIEAYGVEAFIARCVESVFRYTKQWEHLTERLGFWIHLDEAYVTFHRSYVESVWWALKQLFDRGLLYQGHKIVWWWAQGGTALSSGEVGQGYRQVADPSVYVRFPLIGDDGGPAEADMLVWTTTPWTLPSNQFAAVHPELPYAFVASPQWPRPLIVAAALVETVMGKLRCDAYEIEKTVPGRALVGRRYLPPFDFYYRTLGGRSGRLRAGGSEPVAWRVVAAEFVTIDSGTGVVHQAPAFGEVDYDVLIAEQARFVEGEGPELICAVAPDGKFTADAPPWAGRWVKDCDREIIRDLKARGLLLHQEQYLHDYPFCWRAEQDPLIQYPRKSWFIRTTKFREAMLRNNARIQWLPEHIRDGRFGNFLESNVDWALSRERFWGTPLPVWVCEQTGRMEAVGGYEELKSKPGVEGFEVWEEAKRLRPELPDDLCVHKPYIDAVTYDSPFAPGARMRRVPDVIDCWFDSGAMPFAQWGFPHQPGSAERFAAQFPADFISEAIDQTRGWFYSLLAISTLLFSDENGDESDQPAAGEGTDASAGKSVSKSAVRSSGKSAGAAAIAHRPAAALAREYPHPFRNCIVLGLMLGEDGQKMSKSKRNYREPNEIFDRYGADALRWYFFANQPPWTSIRYSEQAIKDCIPEFLLRLWNCYSFFVIYANIDGFDPAARIAGDVGQLGPDVLRRGEGYRPPADRGELDRWILGELHRTALATAERMDAYDNFGACARLSEFVDALSNWYVRRSRSRFWGSTLDQDKLDAYWTLYECLLTLCKLIAPFTPFIAEAMWRNLAVTAFAGPNALDSDDQTPAGDAGPGPAGADLPRGVFESVHLCDYPAGDPAMIDARLAEQMALVREIVSLGRSARMAAELKVRQPLSRVEIVLADPTEQPWLERHASLICDELNIEQVEFIRQADQYIEYTVLPDLKRLGARLKSRLPGVKKALAESNGAQLLAALQSRGKITLDLPDGPVTLEPEDVQVRLQAKPGWTAAQGKSCVVVLNTELTPELVAKGLSRDLVRVVQDLRKESGCQFTDRIRIAVVTESEELKAAIKQFGDYVCRETLAVDLTDQAIDGATSRDVKVDEHPATIYLQIAARD